MENLPHAAVAVQPEIAAAERAMARVAYDALVSHVRCLEPIDHTDYGPEGPGLDPTDAAWWSGWTEGYAGGRPDVPAVWADEEVERKAWAAGWHAGQREMHDESLADHEAWVVAMESMYQDEEYGR